MYTHGVAENGRNAGSGSIGDQFGEGAMKGTSEDFKSLLDESVRFHGRLCEGQILGVRMAMAGLSERKNHELAEHGLE